MNKVCVLFLLSILMFALTACNDSLQSTNLNLFSIDGITIGDTIDNVNLKKYTLSNKFETINNAYFFEEIRITTDENGIITLIHGNFWDNSYGLSIYYNKNHIFETIDDVTDTLGKNFQSGWYDKEQRLRVNQYSDFNNKINAKFIYNDNEKKLVWIILSRME